MGELAEQLEERGVTAMGELAKQLEERGVRDNLYTTVGAEVIAISPPKNLLLQPKPKRRRTDAMSRVYRRVSGFPMWKHALKFERAWQRARGGLLCADGHDGWGAIPHLADAVPHGSAAHAFTTCVHNGGGSSPAVLPTIRVSPFQNQK